MVIIYPAYDEISLFWAENCMETPTAHGNSHSLIDCHLEGSFGDAVPGGSAVWDYIYIYIYMYSKTKYPVLYTLWIMFFMDCILL